MVETIITPNNKKVILTIDNLHTYFSTYFGEAKAVRGVSFTVPHGKILGLAGETGSGKSVTALSIIKLVSPPGRIVKGDIIFNNQNIVNYNDKELQKIRGKEISMIFQSPRTSLNPLFTIGQQMTHVIQFHLGFSKNDSYEYALNWLKKVGLTDPKRRIYQYSNELSTGMCQRVMIAIALLCKPKLIIADEPTTGLDVTIQAQILDLFTELVESMGTSVLLITHDLGVMSETTDWLAIMYTGKIVEMGPTKSVLNNPRHPYTQKLIASTEIRYHKEDKTTIGNIPDIFDLPPGCTFHPRCSLAFDRCLNEEPKESFVDQDHLVSCFLTNNA